MQPTDPGHEETMPAAATPEPALQAPYSIDEDENDLIVRVPKWLVSRDRMLRFLELMEFKELRSRSELTEAEVAELSAEVKRAVAEAYRHRHGVR